MHGVCSQIYRSSSKCPTEVNHHSSRHHFHFSSHQHLKPLSALFLPHRLLWFGALSFILPFPSCNIKVSSRFSLFQGPILFVTNSYHFNSWNDLCHPPPGLYFHRHHLHLGTFLQLPNCTRMPLLRAIL